MKVLDIAIKEAGYAENKGAIKDIDFSLNEGELLGLIGPNGAGKSTTIKAITGIIPGFSGEIEFLGKKKNYVYIPEQPSFYEKLTLWEHLELASAVHEIERSIFLQRAEKLINLFNLIKVKHHFPTSFSKGMQQKLMIILGLLIEPDVYIIDEPFVGLDPSATIDFINLLEGEKKRGAGILLSTHQLDIAERICDYIVLLSDGQITAKGSMEDLQQTCKLRDGSLFDCFHFLLENKVC
ncbi:ABC-2 type transport system ATP-binding protein [Desulfonispora thiosulfatigenes DSM 11270]|uniref:ABC-2 type transport system ATP-binding protein n=1 Tax=Desulfonispora thiosulfatigenes DSM 11270 TaxID=656914 RepID=A0A1W1UHB9_DESTI|nr:ABC transporter ATP-binding protein [Desulfonispora thiosulfatigenes]SMB80429.1 ABC-2 type transport system ATP-binding protein [Desulfonispora thiosulfatigenes DSM 11270]